MSNNINVARKVTDAFKRARRNKKGGVATMPLEYYKNLIQSKYGSLIGASGITYSVLLELLGYSFLADFEEDDYQGIAVILLKKHDKIAFLQLAYGSCSGCDQLQAALEEKDPVTALAELMAKLDAEIVHKNSYDEMRQFLKNRDWATQPVRSCTMGHYSLGEPDDNRTYDSFYEFLVKLDAYLIQVDVDAQVKEFLS